MLSTLIDFMDLFTFSFKTKSAKMGITLLFDLVNERKKLKVVTLIELCTLLPVCGYGNRGGCLHGQSVKIKQIQL